MFKVLLRKQLQETFAAFVRNSKTGLARSKKSKVGYVSLYVFLLLILMLCFGIMALPLAMSMVPLGFDWLYFLTMGLTALVVSTLVSSFTGYSALFRNRDNDLLLSLPVPAGMIFAVRLCSVFVTALMYLLAVWVPTEIVYCFFAVFPVAALLAALPTAVLMAWVAALLAALIGWLVSALNTRARHKSLVTVLFTLVFVGLYYAVFARLEKALELLTGNVMATGQQASHALPLLVFLGEAAAGNIPALLVCTAVVSAILVLMCKTLERQYLSRLTQDEDTQKTVHHKKSRKPWSVRHTLLHRELLCLSASSTYMLNCSLGTLIMPLLGLAALFQRDKIYAAVSRLPAAAAVPLVCCAVCAVSCSNQLTAPSVSLEGQNLSLLQSLPLTPWQLLRAKLELQLLLTAIPALFCTGCFLLAIKASIEVVLPMFAICFLFCIFTAQLGLMFGLQMPNLHWSNEAALIKRSAFGLLSMLCSCAAAIAIGLISLTMTSYFADAMAALTCCIAVLLGADWLLLRWLKSQGTVLFAMLE